MSTKLSMIVITFLAWICLMNFLYLFLDSLWRIISQWLRYWVISNCSKLSNHNFRRGYSELGLDSRAYLEDLRCVKLLILKHSCIAQKHGMIKITPPKCHSFKSNNLTFQRPNKNCGRFHCVRRPLKFPYHTIAYSHYH